MAAKKPDLTALTVWGNDWQERAGAVLLAESSDRLLRNLFFGVDKNLDPLPTRTEWMRVVQATRGAKLATWTDPDALPEKARSSQTKRGIEEKCRQ